MNPFYLKAPKPIKEYFERKKQKAHPFTPEELEIWDKITEIQNSFAKLKRQHPDEMREWVDGIHALQNVLGWRILRNDYPERFYNDLK